MLSQFPVGSFVWIMQGDYKNTHFVITKPPYEDNVLHDRVYMVRHATYDFDMFISEKDLNNPKKYRVVYSENITKWRKIC